MARTTITEIPIIPKRQKKAGSDDKHGRNLAKCKRYRIEQRREKNKLTRILRSEGIDAANIYADKHELWGFLRRTLEKSNR
jgi:hypothetical protein